MEGVNPQNFIMRGKEMCSLGKESFLERTPPFMGDILWEHLDILQKGNLIMFHNIKPIVSIIYL